MKNAFGLDTAGYSAGMSGFARANLVNKKHIDVTVYDESYLLQEDELEEYINRSISNGRRHRAPRGYVLLKKKPEIKINITRMILKGHEVILQVAV